MFFALPFLLTTAGSHPRGTAELQQRRPHRPPGAPYIAYVEQSLADVDALVLGLARSLISMCKVES